MRKIHLLIALFFALVFATTSSSKHGFLKDSNLQDISTKYLDLYYRLGKYTDSTFEENKNSTESEYLKEIYERLLSVANDQLNPNNLSEKELEKFLNFNLQTTIINESMFKKEQWEKINSFSKNVLPGLIKKYSNIIALKQIEEKKKENYKSLLFDIQDNGAEIFGSFIDYIEKSNEIRDGDIIVAIGNTPQLFLESLKFAGKKLGLISLALSKHPGFIKSWDSSTPDDAVLTPTGLKNYLAYMDDVGLSPKNISTDKRVFFLDMIMEGYGVEFVISQFLNMYTNAYPDVNIINLSFKKDGTEDFKGKFLTVNKLSFHPLNVVNEYEDLLRAIDKTDKNSALRFTPNFPASYWHEGIQKIKRPSGDALDIQEAINELFKDRTELNKIAY